MKDCDDGAKYLVSIENGDQATLVFTGRSATGIAAPYDVNGTPSHCLYQSPSLAGSWLLKKMPPMPNTFAMVGLLDCDGVVVSVADAPTGFSAGLSPGGGVP